MATNVDDGTDDLYAWLDLGPGAASRAIAMTAGNITLWGRTCLPFAEFDDRDKTELAKRAYAYSVLSSPSHRADYDAEIGLKERDIAKQVGKRSSWGFYWTFGFILLAMVLGLFPQVMSLSTGVLFAPGFETHRENVLQEVEADGTPSSRCENGWFNRGFVCLEFTSTSPAWNRALHSRSRMSAAPFALCLVIAGLGRPLHVLASRFVARARVRGNPDTRARAIAWSVAFGVPCTLLASALVLAVVGL